MTVLLIKENGMFKGKCMGKEFLNLKTAGGMRDNLRMGRLMGMEG